MLKISYSVRVNICYYVIILALNHILSPKTQEFLQVRMITLYQQLYIV